MNYELLWYCLKRECLMRRFGKAGHQLLEMMGRLECIQANVADDIDFQTEEENDHEDCY